MDLKLSFSHRAPSLIMIILSGYCCLWAQKTEVKLDSLARDSVENYQKLSVSNIEISNEISGEDVVPPAGGAFAPGDKREKARFAPIEWNDRKRFFEKAIPEKTFVKFMHGVSEIRIALVGVKAGNYLLLISANIILKH